MKRTLFMPFRAGYPSADLHSTLVKPREGLTDMDLVLERCRQRYILSRLYTSELSENTFLLILLFRELPKVRCMLYKPLGTFRKYYTG